jgi:antitoxin component of MazEF toxin-antitoxin module
MAKGQVTFKEALLKHLGVHSGEQIEVEPLPDGRAMIRAAHPKKDIRELFGMLAHKNIHLSLEDIEENSRKGWSGEE